MSPLFGITPTKRQYLDPARFGEAVKFAGLLRGDYCLRALKLLIADCFPRETTSFRGAWLGDPVILASDDSGLPNPGGLITTTDRNPSRNLSALARAEFVDISYRAIAELCREREIASGLAAEASSRGSLLIDLGTVVEQFQPRGLERVLEEAVGRPWRRAYNQARAECSWWRPLPPVDWPL